jgi:hypothetical protein
VIAGEVFTVSATRSDVTGDGVHVPLTTQSNPVAALTASPAAVAVICIDAVVTPTYVDPFPVAPLAIFTPFLRH